MLEIIHLIAAALSLKTARAYALKVLRPLASKQMLICIFTGFSSGLPLYLLLNLLPAWLRSENVHIITIGSFALVQIPYTWKFLWAPLLDRFAPLRAWGFGRRRSWMLITQIGLLLCIAAFGFLSPATNITPVWILAALLALFSATQDIALDAFRRELLQDNELGLGNALHVNAYRIAGLVPGSLSLILADRLPWAPVFWITALFILPGLLMSLASSAFEEKAQHANQAKTLEKTIIEPFQEFINRAGLKSALLILAFVFFYKLGDSLCTALATPFYLDMGFSKTDIGIIAKHAGLWPSVFGALLGGLWMLRLGINRALWLFGFVQLFSILGFAWLAWLGPQTQISFDQRAALAAVIGLEALGVGLGSAAFLAYISRATHPAYTATQFALFTSLAAVPRTFINAGAGWLVAYLGWFNFYWLCVALAVPGMLLLLKIAPWNDKPKTSVD